MLKRSTIPILAVSLAHIKLYSGVGVEGAWGKVACLTKPYLSAGQVSA